MIYRELRNEGAHVAGKFLLDNSETAGHNGYLANKRGVFLRSPYLRVTLRRLSRAHQSGLGAPFTCAFLDPILFLIGYLSLCYKSTFTPSYLPPDWWFSQAKY